MTASLIPARRTHPLPQGRRRRAFTLMEILVVIAIIVALAGISVVVGGSVKRSMTRKSTKVTLETLQHAMDEYLKENPEPNTTSPVPTPTVSSQKPSDPLSDTFNYVRVLQATAAAKLEKIPQGDLNGNKVILDGFGNPIRFVPAGSTAYPNPNNQMKRPYFFSAGADGIPYNEDDFNSLES
jgi:prepilin-type N-terminal cleavage/methylation domain-containing protein